MKIVQIEDFFHPDAGYQVNILSKYMSKQGNDVTIITSEMDFVPSHLKSFFGQENIEKKDENYTRQTGIKIIRVPLKKYISGRAIFKKNIFKLIDELNPDVLYVHGNDTYIGIKVILRAKKCKYKIISDSHMVDFASKNKLAKLFRMYYRMRVTPIIRKRNIYVIRTADDKYVEKRLGIPLNQAPFLGFGSDTMLFHPDEDIKCDFRSKHEISKDDFVVLYAGKLDEYKGGTFFAEAILNKIESKKRIVFVIVGTTAKNEYGQHVEELFSKSENVILRFPTQKYVDLAKYMQASDLFVIPKQCSLSLYDAQACGLPVIAENNSINKERLSYDNGMLFESDNKDSLISAIKEISQLDEKYFATIKRNSIDLILKNYNYEDVAKRYISLIEEEVKKKD